jgi:hypothetical protein
MSYQTGNQLGVAICDALGIDAATIHTIRMEMTVGEVAELTTIGFVDPKRSISDIVRKYAIVPRAGWPAPWRPPLRRPAPWASTRPRLGEVYYKWLAQGMR